MGFFQTFGQPRKAGGARRPEQVDAGVGGRPETGGNVIPGASVAFGVQPIPASMAGRLHFGTSLQSPMVAGRFRSQDRGAATSRGVDGGSPDLGALQHFRSVIARPPGARLGAQAGPSSQAGYPSTNNAVLTQLANMGMPDVNRVRFA